MLASRGEKVGLIFDWEETKILTGKTAVLYSVVEPAQWRSLEIDFAATSFENSPKNHAFLENSKNCHALGTLHL
jgi:hypothetical protein